MKVLITGATGFIGKAFVSKLVAKKLGYDIYCAVRKTSRIEELKELNVNFVNFDLTDFSTFSPAIKGMDKVIHFASLFNFHAPRDLLFLQNVEASQKLAEICLENKVQHFVYCSSAEALGNVINGTEESDYNPDEKLGYYGLSKMEAEKSLLKMQEDNNLPLTIARPSGVIGPGNCYPFNELIESIDKNALNAKIFPGSGHHTVHWTYIDDVVEGFIKIIQNPDKTIGQIFILASDYPQSYKEIFTVIAKKLGKSPPKFIQHFPIFIGKLFWPIIHYYYKFKGMDIFPFKPGSLHNSTVSRSYMNLKAKRILDLNPEVDFETGVEKTVEWMREHEMLRNLGEF
ncbi:MAG: NAD-dependent epimerase/dehydratase family protein [Candidatus Hodarchaeales archaeon]|jgi:nucleoside-diphosphate-sugar epimerase